MQDEGKSIMRRDMYELGVSTEKCLTRIDGREPGDDRYASVVFSVDQVDILIEWLQEAKKAIEAGEPD